VCGWIVPAAGLICSSFHTTTQTYSQDGCRNTGVMHLSDGAAAAAAQTCSLACRCDNLTEFVILRAETGERRRRQQLRSEHFGIGS
jgi:hypothetical protein